MVRYNKKRGAFNPPFSSTGISRGLVPSLFLYNKMMNNFKGVETKICFYAPAYQKKILVYSKRKEQ